MNMNINMNTNIIIIIIIISGFDRDGPLGPACWKAPQASRQI